MTTTPDAPATDARTGTVGQLLAAVHGEWLRETHTALDPAVTPDSTLWDRWTAARYLGDQFDLRLQRERGLVLLLQPLLPGPSAGSLLARAERLDEMRRQLNELGRRKDTAAEMMELTPSFLALLETWCRQLEGAAGPLRIVDLAEGAVTTLDSLAVAARLPV
jgi:hypothetical protein